MLASRSSVFKAMLEPHTAESQTGRVNIQDMDPEVMTEILRFMYTGNSPSIQTMALDLLSAADRFNLPGLKNMADHVSLEHFFSILCSLGSSPKSYCG